MASDRAPTSSASLSSPGAIEGILLPLKFLVPFVTTLLGPLIIGVPLVALTFWMTQREAHLKGLPLGLAGASAVMLLLFWFIDESTANMHLFYRERLSSVFVGLRSSTPVG